MEQWIGVSEASRILGVSRNTVRKLVQEGILPAFQIKGVQGLQFKREEVEKLIQPVEPHPTRPQKKKKK